jgi:membrane-associated protein
VLATLVLGGIGLPYPEDIALLTAGYLAWRGDAPLLLLAPACLLSILVSDTILFTIGRRAGRTAWLVRRIGPGRIEPLVRSFEVHGGKLMLLARAAIGARGLFFLAAGLGAMRYRAFLAWDVVGGCVVVGLWTALGLFFGAQIDHLRQVVGHVEWLVAGLVTVGVVVQVLKMRSLPRDVANPLPAGRSSETSDQ